MNPVISDLINADHTNHPLNEWRAPVALSLFRYLRGHNTFVNKSAANFVAQHAGTMSALTDFSLKDCETFLYSNLAAWRKADIILWVLSDTDNNLRFTDKYREIANAPIRPMLDMPESWDTEFGGNGTRPFISGRPNSFASDKQREALDIMQATPFTINLFVLTRALANKDCFADAPMERKALEWASENYGKDYFLPLFLDWRGRIYTDSGALCSYQGGDLHRAMCDFSELDTICIDSPEYAHFLASIEAEYGVTPDNYVDVMQEDVPAVYNSKARFFCRLRAAAAIEEILLTGKTRYILQQDATCSGMGHMACIMKDKALAEKTALLGAIAKDADLYTLTATTAVNTRRYFTYRENGCSFDISSLLDNPEVRAELGSRSQAKKTVMVTAYGSSVIGNAGGWLEDCSFETDEPKPFDRVITATSWDDCPTWRETGFVATITAAQEAGYTPAEVFLCLANAYGRALNEHFPSIQKFIGHMRAMYQKNFDRTCIAPTWTSSAGMTCQKTKINVDTDNLRTQTFSGTRAQVPHLTTLGSAAGQAPNFIHSEDASLVIDTALAAADAGFAISPVHDSWGCSPSQALRMRTIVRDSMVALHSRDLLAELESNTGYKELPRGDWDLSDMAANMIGC